MFVIQSGWIGGHVASLMGIIILLVGLIIVGALYLQKAKDLKKIEEMLDKIDKDLEVLQKPMNIAFEKQDESTEEKASLNMMVKNLDKAVKETANLVKDARKLTDSVNFAPAILIIAFGVILLIADAFKE